MKKVILTLAAMGLVAIMSGCEITENNIVSCDLRYYALGVEISHVCAETDKNSSKASFLQQNCKNQSDLLSETRAYFSDGCVGGAVKVCSDGVNTVNYYDADAANKDCAQLKNN